MRKSIFTTMLSVVLALLMATIPSLQIAAAETQNNVEYISEVKIGVGKTSYEAVTALDGYTILKNGYYYVDLNQKAGGGIGSKGERVVYLGYKTTTDRKEAITDLAVMNMKGGYSVKDYELLMEQYMTEQIIPFVDNFLALLEEYRENYASDNEANKARATYIHDALNKLTDDDCGGNGLGDLLLNETKYEMGDAAYEALSEEEKKQHADILTIVAQANGKATLIMADLLTRAADTSDDTWIDRFVSTTYDDLLGLFPEMLPTDAAVEIAKEFDDDTREILSMWSALKEEINDYETNHADLDELLDRDLSAQQEIINNYDPEKATEEQTKAFIDAYAEITFVTDAITGLYAKVAVVDYLNTVEYGEGTLADFFSQDRAKVADDLTVLYPLVASLSAGQRAGLKFIALSDLIMCAVTDGDGFKDAAIDSIPTASIYDGVDRDIYKKGGVALTSDALRAHAAEEIFTERSKLSPLTWVMIGSAAATTVAFGVAFFFRQSNLAVAKSYQEKYGNLNTYAQNMETGTDVGVGADLDVDDGLEEAVQSKQTDALANKTNADKFYARSSFCSKLMIGFGIAMVVLSGISVYMTYRDLVDYYNVDYSPIPKYIVDEKDITAYNEKGEKIVIKNQSAYYKAVETNRAEGDEWFDILSSSADLNGTVGRQWLALYAAKNENMSPIIAKSLKAVVGSNKVPSDYSSGIHMFGSDAVYNLNNTQFVWNNEATSVFIYFNVDASASSEPSTTGSSFSAGYLVLTGVMGLVIGAGLGILVVFSTKRKKVTAEA